MLLLDIESQLFEPMRQGVLVDLLQMTIAMILVDRKARFSYDVTPLVNAFPFHFCVLLRFLWQVQSADH